MVKKEIERKFLVDKINSWSDLYNLFDELVDIKRISQTYLKPLNKEPSARVRKTVSGLNGDNSTYYDFNHKTFIEPGVHKEREEKISEKEYNSYLKHKLNDKVEIKKTRFVFKYKGKVFELDVFKDHLNGLAILEIELKSKSDKFELPPFLKIKREVTNDSKFSNFHLADVKFK